MKKTFLFFVAFICTVNITNASVYRTGEIAYHYVSGLTYEFTLVTYTGIFSNPLEVIECGDGSWDTLSLTNVISLPNGVKKNEYLGFHTFVGIGTYIISFEGSNRIGGIVNIPNSNNVPFFIKATLVVNPLLGINNSTVLNNPSIDTAFVGQTFIYNPTAYDMDGDSLVYILDTCKGEGGLDIPGYSLPQDITFDINTGNFIWNSPQIIGCYNFAIRIEEYRNGIFIGNVIKEIQIIVTSGAGINDNNYTFDNLSIFPNPSDGNYTLQFINNKSGTVEVNVFNILGKEVYSEKLETTAGINHANIDLSGLSDGIYFLRAKIDENLYSAKIIKQ